MLQDRKLSVKLAFCALGVALAIALDAYGAHGLKKIVSENRVLVFERANRYLMFHCLSMFLILFFNNTMKLPYFQTVFYLMLTGVLLFCGSLYVSTFREISTHPLVINIGTIAPFGGVSLIGSWFLLAFGFFKKNKS